MFVSIHAQDGGRRGANGRRGSAGRFNPRPPDGGRRRAGANRSKSWWFQSTPPGWRATLAAKHCARELDVSIHAPRMEGDPVTDGIYQLADGVSILAPRMEGDLASFRATMIRVMFQSTPPGWRATAEWIALVTSVWVSIHAPRMEGDIDQPSAHHPKLFQSTPPGWRATDVSAACHMCNGFQSTPPGWRATRMLKDDGTLWLVQSTPPGWRATPHTASAISCHPGFNPRPPDGGRLYFIACWFWFQLVSIHAPRMEGDFEIANHKAS